MAIEYFCCFHSYRRKIAKLSDQEVGRLFRALLAYSESGEMQELTGRESVAFDFIADDIDRAKEAYDAKCTQNKLNRSKQQPSTTVDDRGQPWTTVDDRGQPSTTVHKTKTKRKTETKTETKSITPPTPSQGEPGEFDGMSEALVAAVQDWLAYKAEKRQGYKATGRRSLLSEIKNNVSTYGEEAVIAVIRQSMAANYQGILFAKLAERDRYAKKSERPASQVEATYTPPAGGDDLDLLEALILGGAEQ